MRLLTKDDIKNIYEYEKVRNEFRAQVIKHKRPRRVHVGPLVTFVFEDRLTLTFQIQEMMRAERIVEDEAVQAELDVYNQLMPAENELSATMFIEIDDAAELRRIMPTLPNIEHHVSLDFGDDLRVPGIAEGDRSTETRTASVHYLKFQLPEAAWKRLAEAPEVRLVIDHPNYQHSATLSQETRQSLLRDREG